MVLKKYKMHWRFEEHKGSVLMLLCPVTQDKGLEHSELQFPTYNENHGEDTLKVSSFYGGCDVGRAIEGIPSALENSDLETRSQVSARYISQDWLGYAVAPGSPWNLWALKHRIAVLTPPSAFGHLFPMQSLSGPGCFHLTPSSLEPPGTMQRETEGTGGFCSSSQVS